MGSINMIYRPAYWKISLEAKSKLCEDDIIYKMISYIFFFINVFFYFKSIKNALKLIKTFYKIMQPLRLQIC